jgi:hypothetical protein
MIKENTTMATPGCLEVSVAWKKRPPPGTLLFSAAAAKPSASWTIRGAHGDPSTATTKKI